MSSSEAELAAMLEAMQASMAPEEFQRVLSQLMTASPAAAAADAESMTIVGEPGLVVKTAELEGRRRKVFINVLGSPHVPPFRIRSKLEADGSEATGLHTPMSVGEARPDVDKTGSACVVHDVVVNEALLRGAIGDESRTALLCSFVIRNVERKASSEEGASRLNPEYTLPKIRYKGALPPPSQRIRRVAGIAEEGMGDNWEAIDRYIGAAPGVVELQERPMREEATGAGRVSASEPAPPSDGGEAEAAVLRALGDSTSSSTTSGSSVASQGMLLRERPRRADEASPAIAAIARSTTTPSEPGPSTATPLAFPRAKVSLRRHGSSTWVEAPAWSGVPELACEAVRVVVRFDARHPDMRADGVRLRAADELLEVQAPGHQAGDVLLPAVIERDTLRAKLTRVGTAAIELQVEARCSATWRGRGGPDPGAKVATSSILPILRSTAILSRASDESEVFAEDRFHQRDPLSMHMIQQRTRSKKDTDPAEPAPAPAPAPSPAAGTTAPLALQTEAALDLL